jgi:hypothetical protein
MSRLDALVSGAFAATVLAAALELLGVPSVDKLHQQRHTVSAEQIHAALTALPPAGRQALRGCLDEELTQSVVIDAFALQGCEHNPQFSAQNYRDRLAQRKALAP